MATEMLRIETMSEVERTLIGLLTPAERRDALLCAAQAKQRQLNRELLEAHIARVLRGEIEAVTTTEDGRSYPTNGQVFYHRGEGDPLTSIGRVPGHEGIHVLRRPSGELAAISGSELRRSND